MANSIARLEKAFRRNPDSPLFARLADLYLDRGQSQRALAICEEGCAHFPKYSTGFIILTIEIGAGRWPRFGTNGCPVRHSGPA